MKEHAIRFIVDYRSATALASFFFFALSVPFRILGYQEHFGKPFYVVTQVVLPTLCAVLMIFVMIKFGKTALWVSVFPLTLGVLSFVFKLFIDPRISSHVLFNFFYPIFPIVF